MKKKRILGKIASFALCAALTLSACGTFTPLPVYAADCKTAYAFGNHDGPFRDLYKESQEEAKQREKERKKAEKERKKAEKSAKKKVEKEAREREKRGKAAKKSAEG